MAQQPRIQAVAFDAFGTLFDVYSVGLLAEQLFPGKGATLAELWRQKQIEYSFIRSLSGRYKPFWDITRDGLDFAAARLGLAVHKRNIRLDIENRRAIEQIDPAHTQHHAVFRVDAEQFGHT